MRHFRELTIGGTVLMGRKTYESLPDAYRPLPGRRNIVVSANPDFDPAKGVTGTTGGTGGAATGPPGTAASGRLATSIDLHHSIEAALADCGGDCFVIGGGSVYEQTLSLVERVYATEVDDNPLSDTYFPELPSDRWRRSEQTDAIWENGTSFRFAIYDRLR